MLLISVLWSISLEYKLESYFLKRVVYISSILSGRYIALVVARTLKLLSQLLFASCVHLINPLSGMYIVLVVVSWALTHIRKTRLLYRSKEMCILLLTGSIWECDHILYACISQTKKTLNPLAEATCDCSTAMTKVSKIEKMVQPFTNSCKHQIPTP